MRGNPFRLMKQLHGVTRDRFLIAVEKNADLYHAVARRKRIDLERQADVIRCTIKLVWAVKALHIPLII